MTPGLIKYLSSVMRGVSSSQQDTQFSISQNSNDEQCHDLVKNHFLVDSKFALSLDEVI
jgi:hypothetical protein